MEIALGLAVAAALAWAVVASARARAARRSLTDARRRADDAESARDAAHVRQGHMLDALSSVALRVDADARIVQVGRHAGRRFGFLVPGLGLLEAFSEHLLAGRVEQALSTMEPQHFEVRLFAEGRHTFSAVVEPYAVDGGPEALVLLTDVSEAVAYQELRSQFVANVSHELRTPLTGLRGLLEALDDPGIDPVTRANFVARCINETQRLEALITDILFLSELEAGEGLPHEDACDLVEAVEEAAADLAEAAAGQGVTIEVTASGATPCPLSDLMARTVARNLLENAIKYAGPGAVARASVTVDDGEVVLAVSDDGAGIPERHLPHIFERFYRADPSRSKRMGGTGLGLSIVKHIAERFGGRVSATSREGFGTTVTVVLPAAAAGEAPAAGPDPFTGSL